MRYILLISFLQWASQYFFIFPKLLEALLAAKAISKITKVTLFASLAFLILAGFGRLFWWFLFPVGVENHFRRYAEFLAKHVLVVSY